MPVPVSTDRRADEIRRKAERIAVLIVSSDYPLVDISIERSNLRDEAEGLFPDRMEIYDRIYESRFNFSLACEGTARLEFTPETLRSLRLGVKPLV